MAHIIRTKLSIAGILLLFSTGVLANISVDEIYKLLREHQPNKAYQLATTMLDEHIGDPKFDFAYAKASREAGHPEHSVYALQRMLMMQPGNQRVLLDLALSHFMLKEYATAKDIFMQVKKLQPPADVVANIDKFLQAIDDRESKQHTNYKGYMSVKTGYDSNVNSSTSETAVAIPALTQLGLGEAPLDDTAREQGSGFAEFAAGVSVTKPLNKLISFTGGIRLSNISNFRVPTFNQKNAGLIGSVTYADSKNIFKLPVTLNKTYVKLRGGSDRESWAIGAEWIRKINNMNNLSTFGQIGTNQYTETASQTVDFAVVGVNWSHIFESKYMPKNVIGSIGYVYNEEVARRIENKYNGYKQSALLMSLRKMVNKKHTIYSTLNLHHRKYKEGNNIFNEIRSDDKWSLGAGWLWQQSKAWSHNFSGSYEENGSNLNLYDYDKYLVSYQLKYSF